MTGKYGTMKSPARDACASPTTRTRPMTRPSQRPGLRARTPREIAHRERVEYSFDPSNGEYTARRVESSEPVVTGWG